MGVDHEAIILVVYLISLIPLVYMLISTSISSSTVDFTHAKLGSEWIDRVILVFCINPLGELQGSEGMGGKNDVKVQVMLTELAADI